MAMTIHMKYLWTNRCLWGADGQPFGTVVSHFGENLRREPKNAP
jgi:hypothetical protein